MSQMATETIIEIETVVDDLTDHEFDIPCDVDFRARGHCDHPARWSGLKACCGDVSLLCISCKDRTILTEDSIECKVCRAVTTPGRHLYIRFEPLSRQ